MRANKARRMLLIALLIAGTQTAYPQLNFPQNLQNSTTFWDEVTSFPTATRQERLASQWSNLSNHVLSKFDLLSLEKIFSLTKYHISKLPKKEKKFLFTYQHLAIYLSGMNPNATSTNDRSGIWMLTYPDATRYGLIVNDLIDERRDIAKSTRAAEALFKDLKKRHGENTEAMFVLGAAGWNRSDKETISGIEEDLTALRRISKDIQVEKSIANNTNWVAQAFDGEVNKTVLFLELGLNDLLFRNRNPTLVGRRIPTGTTLLIPHVVEEYRLIEDSKEMNAFNKRRKDSIIKKINRNIPSPETHKMITYRVKTGDVLGTIAEHYSVRVSKIKKWNNLRSDRIDVNQKLIIYYAKGKKIPQKKVAEKSPGSGRNDFAKKIGKFTIYEVQAGDTLWGISKKFIDVKPEDIMAWNAIGENLRIGQKLKIKKFN